MNVGDVQEAATWRATESGPEGGQFILNLETGQSVDRAPKYAAPVTSLNIWLNSQSRDNGGQPIYTFPP